MKKQIIAAALAAVAGFANAGIVINNSATGTIINDFNSLPNGAIAGLLSQTGAQYGERLAGQTLSTAGGFDGLSGTPSNPLTLLANATLLDNIGILAYNSGKVIYGDLGAQIGEGALSVLLDVSSGVFGFDVVGSNSGQFTVQFFNDAGVLVGSVTQIATDGYFGFQATGGDVIRAVSITNTDGGGIGYDNVQFNAQAAQALPEPGTLALVGLACFGLRLSRRTARRA